MIPRPCPWIVILAGGLAATVALGETPRGEEDLIGSLRSYTVGAEDTLLRIARQHQLGFVELVAANPGVDPWLPGAGTEILLPMRHVLPKGPRRGIVINLADQRLYYFVRGTGQALSFPIGTGRAGCETPLGETRVVGKRLNPSWMPPASIRAERPDLPAVVPPGPANPLGDRALDLAWSNYVIHGTNKPLGIGRRVSHGCIRLYPEGIGRLFGSVTVGTPVRVVDQDVKLGWANGDLYLEVHPTQSQADEVEAEGTFTPRPIPDLETRVDSFAGPHVSRVDWSLVAVTARERRGVPVRITR